MKPASLWHRDTAQPTSVVELQTNYNQQRRRKFHIHYDMTAKWNYIIGVDGGKVYGEVYSGPRWRHLSPSVSPFVSPSVRPSVCYSWELCENSYQSAKFHRHLSRTVWDRLHYTQRNAYTADRKYKLQLKFGGKFLDVNAIIKVSRSFFGYGRFNSMTAYMLQLNLPIVHNSCGPCFTQQAWE